jgi:hypothetical protein
LLDTGVEPEDAFVGDEQVRLQGGPGDGRAAAAVGGRAGLGGVDLAEQVAVPVEECAVDGGGAGDGGDADLGAVGDRRLIAVMTRCRRRAESAARPSVMAATDRLVLVMRFART